MLNVWAYFIAELSNEANSPGYGTHKQETGRNCLEVVVYTLPLQHLFTYLPVNKSLRAWMFSENELVVDG